MNKEEALKKALSNIEERNSEVFLHKVENLVEEIADASNRLNELKKKLSELTFEKTEIPDL